MSRDQSDKLKQRQQTAWDAAAPGWKKWEAMFVKNMQPITDELVKSADIKPGDAVLDMATGTGEPALTIAKLVGPKGRVVGVDLSPGMLAVAKERAAARGLTNVTFQMNDDDDLPGLQDNSFDASVCRLGLMFMPDPVDILKSIRRVLKPGRSLAAATWASPEKVPFFSICPRIVAKHFPEFKPLPAGTQGGPFAIPSAEMLKSIFGKAGYSNFNSHSFQVTLVKDVSPEEYWEAMSEFGIGFPRVLTNATLEKRNQVRDEVTLTLRDMFHGKLVSLGGEAIVGAGVKA